MSLSCPKCGSVELKKAEPSVSGYTRFKCKSCKHRTTKPEGLKEKLRVFYDRVFYDAPDVDTELPPIGVPKVLYYDIETTNFGADFGEILMFAYTWGDDDEVKIVSITDFPQQFEKPVEERDKPVVKLLLDLLNEADIIVAHYGAKFDNKFLQARAMIHGYKPADVRHSKMFDTCLTARKNLRLQNNRLDNVAEALGLAERKSSLPKRTWRRANDYCTDALADMADYCIQDVVVLREVAKKLRPLTKHLPSFMLLNGDDEKCCYSCGGQLKTKGWHYTKANKYERYQCSSCGAWQRAVKPVSQRKSDSRTMY